MTELNKARKQFLDAIKNRDESLVSADLGNYEGVVLTGVPYQVFARIGNGQVVKVFNQVAPNVVDQKVWIGKRDGSDYWQVVSIRGSYANMPAMQVPPHDETHRYMFIYADQLIPLLAFPVSEFIIQIMGKVVGAGPYAIVESQQIDLSASQPADGALYVLIQYDETTGAITTIDGTPVDAKELLTIADIPDPDAGNVAIWAVRMYDSQTAFAYLDDFIDLRFNGGGGGGSLPTLTAKRVVVTDATGEIITDADFYYDEVNSVLILGDPAIIPIPALGENIFWMVKDGASPALLMAAYGGAFAPFITGFKADGSESYPSNVKDGQVLFRMRARGHDGSDWTDTQGEILFVADGDWDVGDTPVRIESYTTPVGSGTMVLAHTINSDGGITYPILTADPGLPLDGEMWLLRESVGGHADGEAMGTLGMTYTGDAGADSPLQLSVNDDGVIRRIAFT